VPTTDVQPKIVKCIDIIYIKLCPTSGFREFHLKTTLLSNWYCIYFIFS